MRILVVEDDFTSRTLLNKLASRYGEAEVAADGREAVQAFTQAVEDGSPYDLVLLDIMMPLLDGHQVLNRMRELEEARGLAGLAGAKVVMVTALDDYATIMKSFRGQCEGYIVKPVTAEGLEKQLREIGLI